MTEYYDATAMLVDILGHVEKEGVAVRKYDNPFKLHLGFCTDSHTWVIRIPCLRSSAMSDELRQMFSTPEGRTAMADSLSKGIMPGT
jgi:hypothetical protein